MSIRSALGTLCGIAVELSLIGVVVAGVLAPIHASATRHLVVSRTESATTAIVSGDTVGLAIGQTIPLYRFNYGWKTPISEARVTAVSSTSAAVAVVGGTASWPLGKQAAVSISASGATIPLGSDEVSLGDRFNIFQNRTLIGSATVTAVHPAYSEISLPAEARGTDLVASEFTYLTQAVTYDDPLLSGFEIVLMCLVFGGYALAWISLRRSPLTALGGRLRTIRVPRAPLFWIVHLAAGIPFTWFLANLPLYLGAYFIFLAAPYFGTNIYLYPIIPSILPFFYGAIGGVYYGFLLATKRSPILAFWRFLSYKRESSVARVGFVRGVILWALHLVIVYAFGSTLLGFLAGDIAAARAIGWHPDSMAAAFEFWKYVVWSLTVVGVLIGYGHSVLSILWGRYIRNLDFTVVGWLTNAFCYPLLGVVIWQMTPSFTGADPIVTAGPLSILVLILGLVLNVLYMLSIWNLGFLFDLMADKGVRTSGFYSVIRHPNYTLEASMFFATELVGLSGGIQWAAIMMYFFLYWIRSEREDNFMWHSNPAYREYQRAAPYKFIPGFY